MSVVVDDAHVECDGGPINFKPTVMFQTRVFNFALKNTGLGSVNYKWAVQTLDGTPDLSGMYSVSCLVCVHQADHYGQTWTPILVRCVR